MSIDDLSRTIKPKSDQLNYDDLLAGPLTVTVQDLHLTGADDQPIAIVIGNGYQTYKPCKSMRKLLIFCWGKDGRNWIGRTMTLFGDPSVKWAGQAVGGIRISHISHIDKQISLSLTATRGQRKPYVVEPLRVAMYNPAEFDANFPQWAAAIKSSKLTPQAVIAKVQQKGMLTPEQSKRILDAALPVTAPVLSDEVEL